MKYIRLHTKLFLYFTFFILFSLISVGVFTYSISSGEIEEMVEGQMAQIVGNAVHHTDLYLEDYERSIVAMLMNRRVREFIDIPENYGGYTYYSFYKSIREVLAEPLFIRNPRLAVMYIIGRENVALHYFNGVNESLNPAKASERRAYLLDNSSPNGEVSIINHSILSMHKNEMITLTRRIRGMSSLTLDGIIGVEFRSADLSALWSGIDMGTSGYFFIIDNRGRYIYHPERNKVGTEVPIDFQSKLQLNGNQAFMDSDEGIERMYMSRMSEFGDWRLVVSMSLEELRKPVANIRSTTLIVALITLLLALMFAYRFGKSITQPVKILKSGMKRAEIGSWKPIQLPARRDEISELMLSYNSMVSQLSDVVNHVVKVELQNKEIQLERHRAELQSLQLQINPHFMYNTLETIVCYAAIKDSEEISDIVKSLAYMLRYSVQTNLEEITVANELKHILHYSYILQHRIGREIEIEVAVKPEYLLYAMVRLTLQPLVENVFQHAFPDGMEDYHFIQIDAGITGDVFWLSVEDNGCGMTADRLHKLRAKLNRNRLAEKEADENGLKSGIGILNVHRRIQMVFGDAYGLRVESQPDKGTKMIMEMPGINRK